ncbi:hypothetical protein ABT294_48665 [Nonomuraea sp. NPDC000554]
MKAYAETGGEVCDMLASVETWAREMEASSFSDRLDAWVKLIPAAGQ